MFGLPFNDAVNGSQGPDFNALDTRAAAAADTPFPPVEAVSGNTSSGVTGAAAASVPHRKRAHMILFTRLAIL
jgi:hypothetical protein